MTRVAAAVLVFLAATGCASAPAARGPAPTLTIAQTTPVELLYVAPGRAVPVDYRISVTNPADYAVTLRSVEIETVGYSGSYTMKRVRHAFTETIAPRATRDLDVRAWVAPLQESERGRVESPVLLRGTARFDSEGSSVRVAFAEYVRQ